MNSNGYLILSAWFEPTFVFLALIYRKRAIDYNALVDSNEYHILSVQWLH